MWLERSVPPDWARPGDKTIMDALMPAVDAFRGVADDGKTISHALADAAHAARRGAESTQNFSGAFRSRKADWPEDLGIQ